MTRASQRAGGYTKLGKGLYLVRNKRELLMAGVDHHLRMKLRSALLRSSIRPEPAFYPCVVELDVWNDFFAVTMRVTATPVDRYFNTCKRNVRLLNEFKP